MSSITMCQGQLSVEEKWRLLTKQGVYEDAILDESEYSNTQLPQWLDPARLRKSQGAAMKHFSSVNFSHLCGLLVGLQVPEALFPLLTTKKSESIPALFNRYLSTTQHVTTWYQNDLLEDDKALKSVKHVRSLHRKIMQKLNGYLNNNDGENGIKYPPQMNGRKWLNQTDMVATQWAFIGLLILFPERCGMNRKSDLNDLLDIIYIWRCLGYFMGIRDEYNLCSESEDYEYTRSLCEIFLKEVYIPYMKPLDGDEQPMGYRMALDVAKALSPTMPSPVNGNVFIHYWAVYFEGIDERSVPTLNSFWDYFAYYFMMFQMQYMMTFCWFKRFSTYRILWRLNRTAQNRKEITKEFQAKYPEIRYQSDDFKSSEFVEYKDFFTVTATKTDAVRG